MRRSLVIVTTAMLSTGLAVPLATASAATAAHGRPVYEPAPTSAPATHYRHHVCTVDSSSPSGPEQAHGLVTVNAHPTSVTAVWLPGLNDETCKAKLRKYGPQRAQRLAAAIRHSRRVKDGSYACPNHDGTAVDLYFSYAGHPDEYVGAALSGCAFMSAPGRNARWESNRFDKVLKPVAPHPWRSYL